jgi:Tfp pilus assembly protein PilO
MMKFIMPIILVAISVAVFFVFTNPIYGGISELKAQSATYDEALDNSKALETERDVLTKKESSITAENILKLRKLLPENIDNIRLILEIEQIALPFGMVLKDVKYNSATTTTTPQAAAGAAPAGVPQGAGTTQAANPDYGVWDLSFSTTGTYDNFLNFTRALESNLRIVDISAIQFSSNTAAGTGPKALVGAPAAATGSPNDLYTYDFKIKTYWLNN